LDILFCKELLPLATRPRGSVPLKSGSLAFLAHMSSIYGITGSPFETGWSDELTKPELREK